MGGHRPVALVLGTVCWEGLHMPADNFSGSTDALLGAAQDYDSNARYLLLA